MKLEKPFHEGEIEIQTRVGERDSASRNGTVIQDEIMVGALRFIEQQPFAVAGTLDAEENVWASILFGQKGFLKVENERTLEIDLSKTAKNESDPFWENIRENKQFGLLAIELATRRRLRINGEITEQNSQMLRLNVSESYPNCPKYIQRRSITNSAEIKIAEVPQKIKTGEVLIENQIEWIHTADTLFVASSHPERGIDASHRGGNPGFVEILDEKTLRIPDYIGNSMFNTLGNFVVNSKAGIVFFDFQNRRTLQLIGTAEIRFDLEDLKEKSGGTKRFWDFTVGRWQETVLHEFFEWEFLDFSPFNPDFQGEKR